MLLLAAAVLAGCGGKDGLAAIAAGRAQLQNGNAKAAVIELKNAIDAAPDSAEAHFVMAEALLATGDGEAAVIEVRKAQNLGYSGQTAPTLARALLQAGEFSRVVDEFAAARSPEPWAAADIKTSVAIASAALGKLGGAEELLREALALQPDNPRTQLTLARVQAASGNREKAGGNLDALLARRPNDADAWQFKGTLALERKDQTVAAEAFRKTLTLRADDAPSHAALISLAFLQNDLALARRQFQDMKKALPEHPQTLFFEAEIAYADRDYARARQTLQLLLRHMPEDARVLQMAGATEMQLGAAVAAEALLAKAVKAEPGAAVPRRLLARLHLQAGKPAKALAVLNPLLNERTTDVELLTLAGQASLMNGDARQAEANFLQAARVKPEHAGIKTAVNLARISQGKVEGALVDLQKVAAADRGVSADLALISSRVERRQFDEALRAIAALEAKQPDSPLPPTLRGWVLVERHDATAARKSFEQALAKDPDYVTAVSRLAALDMMDGKSGDAAGRFEALLKRDPRNVEALLSLADLKARTGAPAAQVAELLGAAIAASPTDERPRMALIELHMRANDAKSAMNAAQAAVEAQPDNPNLLEAAARAQTGAGDLNQARRTLARLATLEPDAPRAALGMVDVYLAQKDLDQAAASARRALELGPDSIAAYRAAVTVALRRNKPQEAIDLARAMQKKWPALALGYILEGEAEVSRRNWDAAAEAFRKATGKPGPAQSPGQLHFALRQGRKAAEAERFAAEWLRGHPRDILFLFHLGDDAMKRGELPVAERRFAEVLKLQPNHVLALNNLAWTLVQQDKPGAVPLAEEAVRRAPESPALLDTLAQALAGDKQYAKAIDVQKRAIAQAPQVAELQVGLARIYLRSGDKAQARAQLQAVAQSDKATAERPEVQQLMRESQPR